MRLIEIDGKKYVEFESYMWGRRLGIIQGLAIGIPVGYALCVWLSLMLGW